MPRRSILLFAGACIAIAVALAIITVVVVSGRAPTSDGGEVTSTGQPLVGGDFKLVAGDRLLLAGRLSARRNLDFTLDNANELDYVLTGSENSGTWFGRWLATRTTGGQGTA